MNKKAKKNEHKLVHIIRSPQNYISDRFQQKEQDKMAAQTTVDKEIFGELYFPNLLFPNYLSS